jgi:hypothetical protein
MSGSRRHPILVLAAATGTALAGATLGGALVDAQTQAAPSASASRALVQRYVSAIHRDSASAVGLLLSPRERELVDGHQVSNGHAQALRYYESLLSKITGSSYHLSNLTHRSGLTSTNVTASYRFYKVSCKPVIHGRVTFTISDHAGKALIDQVSTVRKLPDLPPVGPGHC